MLWLNIRKVLILFTVLVMTGMMASAAQGESSLSGVWQFTLTGTYNGSDPAEPLNRIVFSMALQEVGSYLFGTIEQERLLGVREGKNVSFRILSHGWQAGDEKNMGIQNRGEMRLKLINNNHMKGDGIGLEPAIGSAALEAFAVEAVRIGPLEDGTSGSFVDWCHLLHLDTIVSYLIGKKIPFVKPCDTCTITKDGGGFYALGQVCPDSSVKPILQATVYVPVEASTCQTRIYSFNIIADKLLWTVDDLINGLQSATEELQFLGIQDLDKMATELTEFVQHYGDFAISLGHSFKTGDRSLYISLPTQSDAACSSMQNTSFIKDIMNNFSATFLCGPNIKDTWELRRSPVPGKTCPLVEECPTDVDTSITNSNGCNTGVLYLYLFGTMKVKFD